MIGSLVANLGIPPEIWLFMSFLGCLTLNFKFSRFWSVRNLDLLMLFSLAPGFMMLVGNGGSDKQHWFAFVWLFTGSAIWLIRCLIDLGLNRRPLLEPNLNSAGLACVAIGILGLLIAETVSLPVYAGTSRNPADQSKHEDPPPVGSLDETATVNQVLKIAPIPTALKPNPPQVIFSRVLACIAHIGLVLGLIAVGWWHFDRPVSGLAMATSYLLLPYTRIALVDSGQLVPAALIVAAVVYYNRPALAGGLIGLAAGWMPACLGLVVLWTGFYRKRGGLTFLVMGLAVAAICGAFALNFPDLAVWARAIGARSLAAAGLLPNIEAPVRGSFWSGLDVAYRLPVLIAYSAMVVVTAIWPAEKNLGELIALSAAQLIASQFWYLDGGGTLVLLYLPLVLLMMFRPNLALKRPPVREPRIKRVREPVHPLR